MINEGDNRVRAPADGAEIRNVVARLPHLADRNVDDLGEYLAFGSEDGVSVHPDWEARGHDGLREAIARLRRDGIQGPGANTLHLNTTLCVHLDGKDSATAESYWQYWDVTAGQPRLSKIGLYRDTFVRTSHRWKLKRRVVTYGSDA